MSEPELTVVPVPKPEGAFDKNRPANTLLRSQVHHLREIELRHMIPSQRTGMDINSEHHGRPGSRVHTADDRRSCTS